MQNKAQTIIESGDLEAYLLGDLSAEQSKKIAQYIQLYPEVKIAFNELQVQLENFYNAYKKTPPSSLKTNIEKQIKQIKRFARFSWAAVLLSILVLLGTTFYTVNENKKLLAKQSLVDTQIEQLTKSFDNQLEELRKQFIVLNSPETKITTLERKFENQDFKFTAYINPTERLSYLKIDSLPVLSNDKCYQLWISRNGLKQSIGILPEVISERLFIPLPFKEKATAYITIENKPGNLNPKAKNAIAIISIE